MIYEGVSPPLEKDFRFLNKAEAKRYFDWFIGIIPERIAILKRSCTEGGAGNILDFTPESLVPLWRLYLGDVQFEQMSQKEYDAQLAAIPERLKPYVEVRREVVAPDYRIIAWDISIYFAQCMLKACPKINWGIVFRPKNYVSVNRPILVGFEHNQDLDTHELLQVQMERILDNDSSTHERKLLELFSIWKNKAPK